MKYAFNVILERGMNDDGREYLVVAASAPAAMNKAIRAAQEDSGVKTGWRVINLHERKEPPIS